VRRILFFILILFFFLPFDLFAGETPFDVGRELAKSYLHKVPAEPLGSEVSLEEAMSIQNAFVNEISKVYGPVTGYKAGLTSRPLQNRFNVSRPLRGVLLQKMLLKNGAFLPADFGTRPMSEGDLIMRVGSARINTAKDRREALSALDAVIPFIELPDLVYHEKIMLDGPAIAAINVGARLGVLGEAIPIASTDAWEDRLRDVQLEIIDGDGNKLAEGTGSMLLDHPLNVVLWIRDSLKEEGKELRKGDLLSLGSITKMIPVRSGSAIRARYTGLDPQGPVEVSVNFK
jgi:2-keto-4-pentenoate hydratase